MNYRHHFHAGNFADVMKHVLLVRLILALQKKEKGFLYLDTHAGRGSYDLSAAEKGDTLARKPEFPDGIGRLWTSADAPPTANAYLDLVRKFDADRGNTGAAPKYYPGSPAIAQRLARPQDRLVLYERQPDEAELLDIEFGRAERVRVNAQDGYGALRAALPSAERRALVLVDPPFESQDEFARIAAAVGEGLARLSSAVIAIWYPLTERARVDAFFAELLALRLPPTLEVELMIAGEQSALKLKGCGLVVINPPWMFEREAEEILGWLADGLAQEPGAGFRVRWLVAETRK